MSRLINVSITPISTTPIITDEEFMAYGLIDTPNVSNLQMLLTAAKQRIERYLSLVLTQSTVKAHYRQERGGTDVELFFCNGIPLGENNLPVFDGLPDGAGVSGFDGGYHLTLSGQQDFVLSYQAGYETLPEWAKLAIMQDALWHYENLGDSTATTISPEAMATIAPFRQTLHEFIL